MGGVYDDLDRPALKTFVQTVSRAFYDASHVIVLDQLLKRDACVLSFICLCLVLASSPR